MKQSFFTTVLFITMLPSTICTMAINQSGETNRTPSYHSTYQPTALAESVLRSGSIIDPNETPQQMMERVVHAIFAVESKFNTNPDEIRALETEFGKYLDAGYCVMSTPILTNAGRYENKPLSACTVPAIDLKQDIEKIASVVDQLHQDGMGTGFNLDEQEDPVEILKALNRIAIAGSKSGKEDRPVGNIALLSINHPKIVEFIDAKNNVNWNGQEWKFNISVNVDDTFMQAFSNKSEYQLRDGKKISAQWLMEKIAKSVHLCGDPGFLFLSRVNKSNPTPGVGEYISVAPCGEVGLAAGESCLFGYINIGKFIITGQNIAPAVDFKKLEKITRLMVRALDNALELSIEKYAFDEQCDIMKAKRKIGIGICGLADLFIQCDISYADEQARALAQDIIAFINYTSKLESHELAKTRGSFEAIALSPGCTYNDNPGFIEQRFGNISTQHVSAHMWHDLAKTIRETKLLRNSSTIALPPTGRSSLLIDASAGIEPLFSLVEGTQKELNPLLHKALSKAGILNEHLIKKIGSLGYIGTLSEIPESIRATFKTALELSAEQHIAMLEALQVVVDEAISKTVNAQESVTIQEIITIFCQAYTKGLKGITIYRSGSRTNQPKNLGNEKQ